MTTQAQANGILDRLVVLDKETTAAYYEMGQLLHAIKEGKLYEVLGYESLTHLIEEELTFTPSTAHKYRWIYADFKRLHYNKAEAIKLLQAFGMTNIHDVLHGAKTKLGSTAIKNRIADLDYHQVNFQMTTKQWVQVEKKLIAHGAVRNEHGRLEHSSDAFLDIIRNVNGPLKKAA